MVKAVWKYPFPVMDRFTLNMPFGAEVLSTAAQGDIPCLWARVDPEAPLVFRKFVLVGTGPARSDLGGRFIGTFQLMGGTLIYHLFEGN